MNGVAHISPRWVAIGTGLGLLLAACAGGTPSASPRDAAGTMDDRGSGLYVQHCAACHGMDGSGSMAVSDLFYPRIRAFSSGKFQLVSTENGVPTDEDLIAVIQKGAPGTAMPPFGWMSDRDLQSLATHVRYLAVEGLVPDLLSIATVRGEVLTEEQARTRAVEQMTPGARVPIGAPATPTAEVLDAGRSIYIRNCAACHGLDGKGLTAFTWPELVDVQWARDLTAGILRGGDSHEAIETRIRAGMPGATMPPTALNDEEISTLVAYVQTLIPDGAADRYLQRPEVIPVRRVEAVPTDPEDPRWAQQDEVRIVLAPMWWREGSVTEAFVTAVHDGDNVSVHLRWRDDTRNDRVFGNIRPDGAALQLSDGENPPIFGMGAPDHSVNIWHWKAFSPDDILGLSDFLGSQAHVSGIADVPTYRPAPGVVRPRESGEAMQVGGIESVQEAVDAGEAILAAPAWYDDQWRVVLSHPMGATRSGIELTPGTDVVVALGIWNGGAGDAGGQKSISIWHQLSIDR